MLDTMCALAVFVPNYVGITTSILLSSSSHVKRGNVLSLIPLFIGAFASLNFIIVSRQDTDQSIFYFYYFCAER